MLVSADPIGVSPAPADTGMSDTGTPGPAPREHVNQYGGEKHTARQDVFQWRRQRTRAQQGHPIGDAADHQATKNTVDCLTPAAEEADPADDGGSNRVQDELAWVGRVGAVLTVEERTEENAAEASGRRAQRESPGADGNEADASAARCFGVAADGIDVAAKAGPLEQERPSA